MVQKKVSPETSLGTFLWTKSVLEAFRPGKSLSLETFLWAKSRQETFRPEKSVQTETFVWTKSLLEDCLPREKSPGRLLGDFGVDSSA